MVNQKFPFSKILVIFLCVLFFVFNCLNVRAEGPYFTLYQDTNLYFYKGNFSIACSVNSNYSSIDFRYNNPDDVITFFYRNNYVVGVYSVSKSKSIIELTRIFYERDGDVNSVVHPTNNNISSSLVYDDYDVETLPYITNTDLYWSICREFAYSSLPDDFKPSAEVDWLNARPSINYALQNVRGTVTDDIFTANWSMPDFMPDAEEYPILVDFTITDLATNEKAVYAFPALPDVYGASRSTPFDALDLTLSIDLNNIKDLPTDYRVDFVALTPYYKWVGEYIELPVFYKGQTSSIYLGYAGHFDFVVQTPPDDPITDVNDEKQTEKGILVSIQNFFSGFFSNFGNMLKDLFIPTKEQLSILLGDMQTFFSEKLGFLWFPFDFAIEIVDAFTNGYADSYFTVPPITINIMAGITLYEGGTFDIDAVGSFVYVRFLTSCILACSVLGLARLKWAQFIEGEFG